MEKPVSTPPVKGVLPIVQTLGEDAEDSHLLRAMAIEARDFLESFAWCNSIREAYFGNGVGGVVAVFLFHIDPSSEEVDEWLWVIVGDIPPAYLVIDDNTTPSLALQAYIEEMSIWVKQAESGRSIAKAIPVNKAATKENAKLLQGRLKTMEEIILPRFRDAEMRIATSKPSGDEGLG